MISASRPAHAVFKNLPPKDILQVLTAIGANTTLEALDRPTSESVIAVYKEVAMFAYDTEIANVRAQVPPDLVQYSDIFYEAIDLIAIFSFCRQLTVINMVEDFSLKDLWDPQGKRLRTILSGLINFCRYKEGKSAILNEVKETFQSFDSMRLELTQKSDQLNDELNEAQAQHHAEQQQLYAAEAEVQEARALVESLGKQRHGADRVLETVEEKLAALKRSAAEREEQAEYLRGQVTDLQGQVADSNEGLEQDIEEHQILIRQNKVKLEEKVNEKRVRSQRVQVMSALMEQIERYGEDLDKAKQAAGRVSAATGRSLKLREELESLCRSLEARRTELTELEQSVSQVNVDIDRAKEAHEDRVRELEVRRKQALQQHQEAQARRTEEQKKAHALQTQRQELEAEIATVRRQHEADMADLRTRQKALFNEAEDYAQTVDTLLSCADAEVGREPGEPMSRVAASPGAPKGQSNLYSKRCSPGLTPVKRDCLASVSPAPQRAALNIGYPSCPPLPFSQGLR